MGAGGTATTGAAAAPLKVFVSYAHEDDEHRQALVAHLAPLIDDGLIQLWHDRELTGGQDWAREIDDRLAEADIVLMLVSRDFMASDYCKGVEVKKALAMHRAGTARVVPVILRSCRWTRSPIGKLQALPRDAVPITESPHPDQLYNTVVEGIEKVAEALRSGPVDGAGGQRLPVPPDLLPFWRRHPSSWLVTLVLTLALAAWTAESIKTSARDELRIDRPDQAEAMLDSIPVAFLPFWPGLAHLQEVTRLYREGSLAGVDSTVLERRLNTLLDKHPEDADVQYLAARLAFDHGEVAAGQLHAQQALQADPGHAASRNLLGLAADLQGDSATAESHYREAAALQKAVPQFAANQARALLDLDRPEEALRIYQRWDKFILARAESALAYWSLGQIESARDSQVQALEQLDTPAIAGLPANFYDWRFIYRSRPDAMSDTPLSGKEKGCYVAYELAISSHLLNSAAGDVTAPPECLNVRRLGEIVAVIDADLCRYLIQRQPSWAEAAQKVRRGVLNRSKECVLPIEAGV